MSGISQKRRLALHPLTRRLAAAAGLLLGGIVCVQSAVAQEVTQIQPAGADVRLGNLRDQFTRAFQPQQQRTTAPGWTTSASLELDGSYTDALPTTTKANARSGSDVYATITPNVGIQGDSQLLSGSLFYAPQIREYATTRSQDSIAQNLNASGRLTVLPELAYIDLRASSAQQSLAGGAGPNGTTALSQQDQVQSTSMIVTPRVQHRFDDFGQAEVGYTLSKTTVVTTQPAVASPFVSPQANQNLTTTTPYFSFKTGDAWGRFNGRLDLQDAQNNGQGVLAHSYQNTQTVTGAYALDRVWALTGSIGHEAIAYGGIKPLRINDMTWSGGVKITPDPDSSLALSYGSKSGHPSATLNAYTQLTSRIRLTAQYAETLGTQAEDLQNSLATSGIDAAGVSVNQTTGEPLGLNSNFNGTQGGLARTKTASATMSWLLNREAVSLTASQVQSTILTNSVAGGPNSTSGVNGSIAWQHDFSEDFKGNVFVQYGTRVANGLVRSTQDTVTTFVSATYVISQTMSARMQYSRTQSSPAIAGQTPLQNLLLLGLTKTF